MVSEYFTAREAREKNHQKYFKNTCYIPHFGQFSSFRPLPSTF